MSRRIHNSVYSTPWFDLIAIASKKEPDNIFYGLKPLDYVTAVAFHSKTSIYLVKQFRPVINKYCLETPGGHVEANQTPAESIDIELREELGIKFDNLTPIATLDPDVGRLMNKLHVFKAETPSIIGDPEPGIKKIIVDIKDIPALIAQHSFETAYSIAAISLACFYTSYCDD